ncbi:MAG TPA: sensor histidine kinase [Actinocrinis sp.]|jgi:anti-sigma regulatory factor (Ser/Thr protein kinase)
MSEFGATPANGSAALGLRHVLYPYSGAQQYLDGTVSYIDHVRNHGGTVVVAAPESRQHLLRSELPSDDSVTFVDTDGLGTNPARIIPAWREWIGHHAQNGRPVYGISESAWSGRTTAQLQELRYHEWLLNRAFAELPAWSLLCPYDTSDQMADTVSEVTRLHPWVWNEGDYAQGPDYVEGPYAMDRLPEPVGPYEELAYTIDDLPLVRDRVVEHARPSGMGAARLRDLLIAVTEVVGNSIRHGGGRGMLRIWVQDGAVVCETRDAGVITDPLVGCMRPTACQIGGRGLWFANQLCDLVQIRSGAPDGTRVRLHMDLPELEKPTDGSA